LPPFSDFAAAAPPPFLRRHDAAESSGLPMIFTPIRKILSEHHAEPLSAPLPAAMLTPYASHFFEFHFIKE